MYKKIILTLLSLLALNQLVSGQDLDKYLLLINEAEKLYDSNEYLQSGKKYSEAFISFKKCIRTDDRYNAACSWALANQVDSAFNQLYIISKVGKFKDIEYIISDSDLNSLHSDKRWQEVIDIIQNNKLKAEEKLNKNLVAILDTIYKEDQEYRQLIYKIEGKYGYDSNQAKAHWKIINQKDSVNLIKVEKILNLHGWLGPDSIGEKGNITLFLVIQHSNLKVQKKYLPMLRDAVKKGNAKPSNLALLEDRVALDQGKKQIYGSQIGFDNEKGEYFLLPLYDPDNVDIRRAKVGLEKLHIYVSQWGIIWDVEKYKKQLQEIEAK